MQKVKEKPHIHNAQRFQKHHFHFHFSFSEGIRRKLEDYGLESKHGSEVARAKVRFGPHYIRLLEGVCRHITHPSTY